MEGGNLMTDGITTLITVAGDVLEMITGNATLMVFFCAGLAFTAVSLVRKLK